MATLDSLQLLDKTVIVFSSDSGLFFGEHGLTTERRLPYEESTDYRAVRTAQYKYIHWIKFPEQDELYDLKADSLERRNLAADPAYAGARRSLKAELGRLVLQAIGLEAR
jgi:arylsulfatase A-like enzyme